MRSASEYEPQGNIADASGKYIDYCQQAIWQFGINKTACYRIWLCTQVPMTENWTHTIYIDGHMNSVYVGRVATTAKKWYWICVMECGLRQGIH